MAKSKLLPNAPTLYRNPYVQQSTGSLYNSSVGLLSPTEEGLPYMLRDTVRTSPEMTQQAITGMRAQLTPELNLARQDMINQLELTGGLTSSTSADSMSRLQSDFESRMVAAGAQAAMADIQRAMQNRVGLYGMGMEGLSASGQLALSDQEQVNNFNLDNYQNLLAKHFGEQPAEKGGLMGALTGGMGGAMAGAMFGPVGMIAGGLLGGTAGALGPAGTGGGIMTAGAGMAGSMPNRTTTTGTAPKVESIDNVLMTPSFYGNSGMKNPFSSNGLR